VGCTVRGGGVVVVSKLDKNSNTPVMGGIDCFLVFLVMGGGKYFNGGLGTKVARICGGIIMTAFIFTNI
jgi:hypothetical protein